MLLVPGCTSPAGVQSHFITPEKTLDAMLLVPGCTSPAGVQSHFITPEKTLEQ